LRFKKFHPKAKAPSKSNPEDAGFDLFAIEECGVGTSGILKVRTGIGIEIPSGYVGLIWDRSGLSIKHGIHRVGGVIDSTYRGEIVVGLISFESPYNINIGDKIAQILIQPVWNTPTEWIEVEELSETDRGEKGFGSSGK
jgi:dUTP pyrophosphatase